jgi:ATP/maltotriose-dependent transcriptional regulator MalT
MIGASGAGAEAGEIWLTPREMDVLRLVALGWSNEHVAKELEISLHTVRSHVANIRGNWMRLIGSRL